MTNDRELLELAANAAGGFVYVENMGWIEQDEHGNRGAWWNPFGDDGDALRLAVKLGLLVDCYSHCARPLPDSIEWQEASGPDDYANTRRAIVRAAAEIGRTM